MLSGNMFIENLLEDLEGEFDLLVFYKSLEALLRDRKRLDKSPHGRVAAHFRQR